MLLFAIVLFLPLLSQAIILGKMRGPIPNIQKHNVQNSTWSEEMRSRFKNANNATSIYKSGYLRTDFYDLVRDVWVQAQVIPIGVCYRQGFDGGSAMLSEVIITDDMAHQSTSSYQTPDCSGEFTAYFRAQPVSDVHRKWKQIISHVADLKEAVQLIPASDNGVIVSSYYSSDGCSGKAAQYDIVSDRCTFYGPPFMKFGTAKCNIEAATMVMALYDTNIDDKFVFPSCSSHVQGDTNWPHGDDNSKYLVHSLPVSKQPLSCSDQTTAETKTAGFPYYQTVQCVTGVVSEPAEEDTHDFPR